MVDKFKQYAQCHHQKLAAVLSRCVKLQVIQLTKAQSEQYF